MALHSRRPSPTTVASTMADKAAAKQQTPLLHFVAAAAVGFIAGWLSYRWFALHPEFAGGDFTYPWRAAGHLLAGRDPYQHMPNAPYGTGAASVALDKMRRHGWIGVDSWIAVETGEKEVVEVAGYTIDTDRKVGKARLSFLRYAGER